MLHTSYQESFKEIVWFAYVPPNSFDFSCFQAILNSIDGVGFG